MYFAKGVEKVKTIEVSKKMGEHIIKTYDITPVFFSEEENIYKFVDNELIQKIIGDMGFFEKFIYG